MIILFRDSLPLRNTRNLNIIVLDIPSPTQSATPWNLKICDARCWKLSGNQPGKDDMQLNMYLVQMFCRDREGEQRTIWNSEDFWDKIYKMNPLNSGYLCWVKNPIDIRIICKTQVLMRKNFRLDRIAGDLVRMRVNRTNWKMSPPKK